MQRQKHGLGVDGEVELLGRLSNEGVVVVGQEYHPP